MIIPEARPSRRQRWLGVEEQPTASSMCSIFRGIFASVQEIRHNGVVEMSAIYDNWERLVAAVLKKQQLLELFHAPSRSPSILTDDSDSSSRMNLSYSFNGKDFDSSWSQKATPKLVILSYFNVAVQGKGIFSASARLLGRGTFGSTYSAKMDNGVTIVVKRLKSGNLSELDFKRHMDIVGNVCHENVAPLHAYYCCEDERMLVYDYYSEGSVHALLHGQTGQLDWDTRLRIAVGAARGITQIHAQNDGKIVHGNIKSSNIFLNSQWFGCVSDLGLANIIPTTFMPTALCYAPEVRRGKNVSQASDVYSFGILLLELLTRKSCLNIPGGPKSVDLVKLVSSSKSKDRAAQVFDADLLLDPTIRDDMVEILQIGIKCVAKSIKKRPKMSQVVKMLEEIVKMKPASHALMELTDLTDLGCVVDANPAFYVDDMPQPVHGLFEGGTFGISYKAQLKNGDLIMMKRLNNVIVTLKAVRQHTELCARMRHKNIAALIGYYYQKNTTLLAHRYYSHGSVYDLLHGKRDTDTVHLSWKNRLEIAIGAARGIAHIHGYAGQKLVHGNIKLQNILLDGLNCGIVSDFGLSKLTDPIRLSNSWHDGGYCAPEVIDSWDVSQGSDVYSFGVVLLELASGKIPHHITYNDEVVSLVTWVQSVARDGLTAVLKVFDVELLKYQNEEKEEMVRFLQVAMDCVEVVPEDRPGMAQVVKRLEEIRGGDNEALLLEDTWREPSVIESRFECLLDTIAIKLNNLYFE